MTCPRVDQVHLHRPLAQLAGQAGLGDGGPGRQGARGGTGASVPGRRRGEGGQGRLCTRRFRGAAKAPVPNVKP